MFDDEELDLLRREPSGLHEKQLPPPAAARAGDRKSRRYLVECNGRLVRVTRYHWHDKTSATVSIEVHVLEPNDSWTRVRGIVGRALFVGDACSGSFPGAAAASLTSDDMIRENQIIFVDGERAISAELDKRNRSAFIRTVQASGDLYGSVLRTVEACDLSGERCSVYRPARLSARTGQWHPERRFHSLWCNHGNAAVI